MKNRNKWVPTKALIKNGSLVPNLPGIFGGSYHTIKLQLQVYQQTLAKFATGDLADLGCGKVPYYECYRNYVTTIFCADRFENEFTDGTVDLSLPFPFKDESFDTVLCSDVINHIPDPDNFFSESLRVLRKEGHLIIFTPFLYWISEAPNDYYRFTRFALEKKASEHRFEVIELFSYGRRRDVLLDFIFKKFHSRVTFRPLKAVSDIFFRESSTNTAFEPFPLGYILVARKK